MKNKRTKADEVRELYHNLNGNTRQKWREVNQEGHNFYLDNQLTEKERKALTEQGMPTFTINRVIPIVEMLSFYATANTPRWLLVLKVLIQMLPLFMQILLTIYGIIVMDKQYYLK